MIDEKFLNELREYLKDNLIPFTDDGGVSPFIRVNSVRKNVKLLRNISDEASDYIRKHKEPGNFAHTLGAIRQEKGLTPAELYKKANIDRRLYSKITGPGKYHPSKNTVIRFALALQLNKNEYERFMRAAGYALSRLSNRDVCISFCIEKGYYNIDDVNALLFVIGAGLLTGDAPD